MYQQINRGIKVSLEARNERNERAAATAGHFQNPLNERGIVYNVQLILSSPKFKSRSNRQQL